jgi:sugar transferase (PEP-CTERM/EpsH1 system associated)
MRILWVKVGGLWPPDRGGRLRSYHLVSELARRHRVVVATTHGPDEDPDGLRQALAHCEQVVSVPYALPRQGSGRFALALLRSWASSLPVDCWKTRVPALRRAAHRLAGDGGVDVCVADFLAAVPSVPMTGAAPVTLFQHNVEHVIWRRLAAAEPRPWRRALLELEWRKMRRWEARACEAARLTVAVSAADRALLAELAPRARLSEIPTGVDTAYFAPDGTRETANQLVFTGAMDWYPNEDAILHFMDAILPAIRRDVPDVGMTVVGRNPTPRLRVAAARAGVRVTGTVPDVRPYVAEAAVYVVPLRVGGGTRLKIFEALAMGKAVVSTSVGAEGLPLTAGQHFLRADEPQAFARAVTALLADPSRRQWRGQAGRQLVAARYAWGDVARELEAHLEETVWRGNGTGSGRAARPAASPERG